MSELADINEDVGELGDHDDLTDFYDPARRRRRRGRMPAGLARYWAARRGVRAPRRRRRARLYDPVRRRRRRSAIHRIIRYDPRRRSRRIRRHRYDPSIRGMTPFWSALMVPVATKLGSVLHNFVSVRTGKMTGAVNLPMGAKITHLGLIGDVLSVIFGYFGKGSASDFAAHVAAGMGAEGFNVPAIEAVGRPEGNGGMSGGSIGVEPYVPVGAYS